MVRIGRYEQIRHAPGIMARAGPSVIPRSSHQAGLQWFTLNVSAAAQEIALALDGWALEAALKSMADKAVPPMTVMHVGAQ
jgi:hypothetical protein